MRDRIDEDAVETDGGGDERQDTERGGEIGHEPLPREFIFNAESERLDVEDRDPLVQRIELAPHRRDPGLKLSGAEMRGG